jgi:O-antigen/teichoic acid export membrane protein
MSSIQSVPLYGIARRFTSIVSDAFQMVFGSALTSSFSALAGAGRKGELIQEFGRRSRFVAALAGGSCAILHFVLPPFLAAWLPPEFAHSARLLDILLPALALRLSTAPASYFMLAQNRHRTISLISWGLATCALAGMAILGSLYGIDGVFSGIGVAEGAIFGIVVPLNLAGLIEHHLCFHFVNCVVPMIGGALVVAMMAMLAPMLLIPSYPHLATFASLATLLLSVVAWQLHQASRLAIPGQSTCQSQDRARR